MSYQVTGETRHSFLISHHYPTKLMDPSYFKNQTKREQSSALQHRTSRTNNQVNQSEENNNPTAAIKVDYMRNANFGQRNFARLCDSSLIDLSSFHMSQKFGNRIRTQKLQPLLRPVTSVSKVQETKQYAVGLLSKVPLLDIDMKKKNIIHEDTLKDLNTQDERTNVKQILHSSEHGAGIIFLFKSFIISQKNSVHDQHKSKRHELQLSISDMLKIIQLPKLEDILLIFQDSLELIDQGIKIRYGLISAITNNQNVKINLPKKLLIENNYGGHYLIEFPRVELYVPDHGYTQKITLNTQQIFELVRNEFKNASTFINQLDKTKLAQHIESQRILIIKSSTIDLSPEVKEIVIIQKVADPQLDVQYILKHSESNIKQKNTQIFKEHSLIFEKTDILQVVVVDQTEQDEEDGFEDDGYKKRILKQVVESSHKKYIVTFCPSQIAVREKISNRIIKSYIPTFEQFNSLLVYSLNGSLQQFVQSSIQLEVNLDMMELNINLIKNHMEIQVDWPISGEPEIVETGNPSIQNGLFNKLEKTIIINNKHFIVELWYKKQLDNSPPTLTIYDSNDQKLHDKDVSTKMINEMSKRKFYFQFQII